MIVAGSEFLGKLIVTDSKGSSYGVAILGNTVGDKLLCTGNEPGVTDFGAPNDGREEVDRPVRRALTH